MDTKNNWKKIIIAICDAGVTQQAIGDAIDLPQPSIAAFKAGTSKRMLYEQGKALLDLHKKVMRRSKRLNGSKIN